MKNLILNTLLILLNCSCVWAQNNYYTANNEYIQYMGRIDKSTPTQYYFSWSGVSISASFKGTEISAVIDDFSQGSATKTNYFNVFIDGQRVQKLGVNKTDTLYLLASGLSNTAHSIEITKRTEASVGKSSFKGFLIKGNILEPSPQPNIKMEVIGDSRSCGYGNEASYADPNKTPGFNSINEDNYYAWGAVTARNLGYQYHCTSYSGRGMYRNNTGTTFGVLPSIYNRIHPDASSPIWDHNNYTPDLIFILLGTNDFAPENAWGSTHNMLDSSSYVDQYINFIKELRTIHGNNTKIVCGFGSSKSKWTPLDQLNRWRNYISSIVDDRNNAGDNEVYRFEFSPDSGPFGEDWHPTIAGHATMANEVTPFLENIMSNINAIDDEHTEKDISIYPNPTSGKVYFGEKAVYQIATIQGIVLKEGEDFEVDLDEFKNGVYILSLGNKSIRLIKE